MNNHGLNGDHIRPPIAQVLRTLFSPFMPSHQDVEIEDESDLDDMPALEPIDAPGLVQSQEAAHEEDTDDDMPSLERVSSSTDGSDDAMPPFQPVRRRSRPERVNDDDDAASIDSMPSLQSLTDSTDSTAGDSADDAEMRDMLEPQDDDGDSEWTDESEEDGGLLELAHVRTGQRRQRTDSEHEHGGEPGARPSQRRRVEVEVLVEPISGPGAPPGPQPRAEGNVHGGVFTFDAGGMRFHPFGNDMPAPPPPNDPRWNFFGPFPGGAATPGTGAPRTPGSPGEEGRTGGWLPMDNFLNLFSTLFSAEPEKDDPERAARLVAGLEVVPPGLVRRMERVGAPGGHSDAAGADAATVDDAPGCAICWDRLLEPEGEGFGAPTAEQSADATPAQDAEPQKIVSLPCAHVFHASCLVPWFSRPRQTTCPTCRFNIDPDNLTYRPSQPRQQPQAGESASTTPAAAATDIVPSETRPADPPAAEPAHAAPAAGDVPATAPPTENSDARPNVAANGVPAIAAIDLSFWFGPGPAPAGTPGVAGPPPPAPPAQSQPQPQPQPQAQGAPPGGLPPNFETVMGPFIREFITRALANGVTGGAGAGGPVPTGAWPGSGLGGGGGAAPPPPFDPSVFEFAFGGAGNGAAGVQAPRAVPSPFVPPFRGPGAPRGAGMDGPRSRKEWTLPPAPGPTVRQRVETRERELGLRCADPVCGLGPSDEEPAPAPGAEVGMGDGAGACAHTVHPACLVSAERVAGRVAGSEGGGEGEVAVVCPACRAPGAVLRAEWDLGVAALA